jgi:tetratricopeptide (TPR) repeat protein
MTRRKRRPTVPPGGWTPEKIARRERALGRNPWGGGNHNSLGCEFFEMGLWDRAVSEFEIAIEINPWRAVYKANLARACVALGRYADAERAAKAALARDPKTPSAYFTLGLVCEAQERFEDAADWYRICLASGPSIVIRRDVQEDLEIVLAKLEKQRKGRRQHHG